MTADIISFPGIERVTSLEADECDCLMCRLLVRPSDVGSSTLFWSEPIFYTNREPQNIRWAEPADPNVWSLSPAWSPSLIDSNDLLLLKLFLSVYGEDALSRLDELERLPAFTESEWAELIERMRE